MRKSVLALATVSSVFAAPLVTPAKADVYVTAPAPVYVYPRPLRPWRYYATAPVYYAPVPAAHASVVAVLAFFALTAATGVAAQAAERGVLRAACMADAKKFCADVQPGGGRVLQCLHGREKELAPACRDALAAAGR